MTMMRAVVQDRYGSPDELQVRALDRPVPAPGQVLVRIAAASVNGYDVLLRSGALKMVAGRALPKLSGLDFAGSVAETEVGSPFRVGDEVWGVLPLHQVGTIADYIAIDPRFLSHRPANVTMVEAASLPVIGTTALSALRDVTRLQRGERLLVRGASGGVGSVAVQIGKLMGAHVVGLASGRHLAFVRALGADEALDYTVLDPASLGSFDVILDTVGSDIATFRRLLNQGGRFAAIVPDPRRPLRWMAYVFLSRIHGGRQVRCFNAEPGAAMLEALAGFVSDGIVEPHVAGIYPIERIADAHRAFEARDRPGKQVVTLA